MAEVKQDSIRFSCGETIKLGSSYKKYEVEFNTFQREGESLKDCVIRTKKVVNIMANSMRSDILKKEGL